MTKANQAKRLKRSKGKKKKINVDRQQDRYKNSKKRGDKVEKV